MEYRKVIFDFFLGNLLWSSWPFKDYGESSLAMTLASTCGWTQQVPWTNICPVGLNGSLTWFSSTKGKYSLFWTFQLISETCDYWVPLLPVKTESRKALGTSAFSVSFATGSSAPFSSRPTFSLVFLLLLLYCRSLSCCPSCFSPDLTAGCLS